MAHMKGNITLKKGYMVLMKGSMTLTKDNIWRCAMLESYLKELDETLRGPEEGLPGGLRTSQCGGSVRCFGQPVSETHPHLLGVGEVTPGISSSEYNARRQKLVDGVLEHVKQNDKPCERHLVVIPSATKTYMSHDIPYFFRQNTDFLYLCGFQEPDSVLLLQINVARETSHTALLVPGKDSHKELWEGPRSGVDGAAQLTGIENTHSTGRLQHYLNAYCKDQDHCMVWYDYRKPINLNFHLNHMVSLLRDGNITQVESPRTLLHQLRLLKSPAEISLLRESCNIAGSAFTKVMKQSHAGVNESELFARMDFECRMNGAEYLAYPPVVAGGNRANTIHYVANNRIINGGEMVLMDAGCEYHGYASDITRTWPVSGEFTQAQLALYEAVLEVQEICIMACDQPDVTLDDIYRRMLALLGQQLGRLGLLPPSFSTRDLSLAAREFCPHHVGHYLGMDVHDTEQISRTTPLKPGTVITIEPGLYVPESRTDVPADFRGQGIRIEDNILITETGGDNLTINCPKQPQDIIRHCNQS